MKLKLSVIAAALSLLSGWADARPVCVGEKDTPPIYVYGADDGTLFTIDATTQPTGELTAKGEGAAKNALELRKRVVTSDEAQAICRLGYSVSLLDVDLEASTGSAKRGVDRRKFGPTSSLPSSFSIAQLDIPVPGVGSYAVVVGSFWVPGAMPAGRTNQWAAFDVVAGGFTSTPPTTHLVHAVLWDTTFPATTWNNGKGVIAGPYANACALGVFAPTAVMESWSPAPSTEVWGPVAGHGATPLRNSCSNNFSDGVSYGFVMGANNVSQWQSYSQYYSGASTPFYSAAFSTYQPSFLTAAAGVVFLVAGPPPVPGRTWLLSFTGVSSGTY